MKKLYYHGTILTMEEHQPSVEAVYVEDGRIRKAGNLEEVCKLVDETCEKIDLQGKTMAPGFIDPHSHFIAVANALSQCDLSSATSFADIVHLMRSFITEHEIPEGEWVVGNSYDHNFLKEKTHPDKYLLDTISSTHPIVIIHASSHMGSLNSLALEAMHIDETSEDPSGGKYYREADGKEPNGHMEENAFIEVQNKIPMVSMENILKLVEQAQQLYASHGITTVQDGFVGAPLFQLLQYLAKENRLYLDVVGFLDVATCRSLQKEYAAYRNTYVQHLKIGGYKLILDGSPQGRTAWMSKPYEREEEYCGYPAMKDEQLQTYIRQAMDDDMQLLAHCNGDAAAEQYITQFEIAHKQDEKKKTNRPVMIHAQLVRYDQLARMRALEMIPSFFMAHTYFWGDIHIANFGAKRAAHISPAKDAEDLGLCYTFHQDSPVLPPNMLFTLWCAVNRKTRSGVAIGEEERISAYAALKAITCNGAYQYFEEHEKGKIQDGFLADLVILDQNPLTCDPAQIKDINVLETIKEGKTIYKFKA